jgi:hypothetical protein
MGGLYPPYRRKIMEVNKISMNKIEREKLIKEYKNVKGINNNINIPYNIINKLKLTQPLSRQQRRKIARSVGMEWQMYALLEQEIMKRMKANANLETGEINETDINDRKKV